MPAKKSNVKVVIVEQNGEFFVQPAVAVLEKDSAGGGGGPDHDRVKIYNATNEDAVFHISSNIPFGNAVPQTALIGSKKSIVLQVDNGAVANSYPYQVLMVASGKKAKGNSDPMLIIEN